MNKYNILGFLLGLMFITIVFNNKAGKPHHFSINIPNIITNGSICLYNTHIHHWIISIIILLFTIPIQYKSKPKTKKYIYVSIINGFFVLFLFHGLSYRDRFNLLC